MKVRRSVALLAFFFAGGFVSLWFLPRQEWLQASLLWIEQHPGGQSYLLAALYLPAAVFCMPVFPISLVAGFLLPIKQALAVNLFGKTAAALLNFALARGFARPWIQNHFAQEAKFRALDRAVETEGFRLVFLTRLAPFLSFNILNYAYGLTRISWWHYTSGTLLGLIPSALALSYLASTGANFDELLHGPAVMMAQHPWWFGLGLCSTLLIIVVLYRHTKQLLDAHGLSVDNPATASET